MQDIQSSRNAYKKSQSAGRYFREMEGTDFAQSQTPKKKNGNVFILIGFLFTLGLMGVIFSLLTYVFNGASISITPVEKNIPINETFIVKKEDRENLLSTKSLAVSDVYSVPKTTLKKVNKRAQGTITIYNNHSSTSQKLVKGTRFATDGGRIYRIDTSVTVPGKSGNTPGSIEAKVTADSDGESYNLGNAKFTIPGFKGSTKYTTFYAETTYIGGGSSGKSAEVSDLDMEKAKTTLRENLKKTLDKKLESELPSGFVYDKGLNILSYGSLNLVESDGDTATYGLSATGTAVYLKKEFLIAKIVEKSQNIESSVAEVKIKEAKDFLVSVIDPKEIEDIEKPIRLIVTGNALVRFEPNKERIVNYVLGKEKNVFENITKDISFVQNASQVVRPFWANKFPVDSNKIKINFE